ncbi:MAG: hypothetical protein H7070_01550 [Saprospiraceae bacterium]|nr:hypothetical protein [Pyrinomonadaceae bacterium]
MSVYGIIYFSELNMIFNQNKKEIFTFVLSAIIGLIGAFGQAAALHNSLVHSYPYKMMGMPPWHFYAWIGNLGYYIAIFSALIALALSKGLQRYFVAAIPVALCPLAYWLTFEVAFLFSPYYGGQMLETNFEGYTGQTARYAFGFEVLGLMFGERSLG